SFLSELGVSVFTIAHNNVFSRLAGTDGLSAFSIVNYAHSVMLLMFLGIGSAIQPLVSYYHGAKDEKRKRETVRIAIFTAIGAGVFITLLGQVTAPYIVALFGDFSQDVKELATIGIRIFFGGYILMGVNFVMMTYFQSVGQVKMAAWITIGREFLFMLIFLVTLPFLFGTNAAWLSIPLSEVVIFCTILLYLKREGTFFGKRGHGI
ncbi:MAG: MATE family efflux transporter, partial [Peribacillus sp.]